MIGLTEWQNFEKLPQGWDNAVFWIWDFVVKRSRRLYSWLTPTAFRWLRKKKENIPSNSSSSLYSLTPVRSWYKDQLPIPIYIQYVHTFTMWWIPFLLFSRCHIRVIDTFGTEPAYNHEEYATLHGYRTNWGYWNLNTRQYMTMFRKYGVPGMCSI